MVRAKSTRPAPVKKKAAAKPVRRATPVSYTHLDVYKRQHGYNIRYDE